MMIEHYEQLMDEQKLEGIWRLLCRYDHSFIPPLSARENTYQPNLSEDQPSAEGPRSYFNTLKQQSTFLALHQDRTVGFMSYRPQYICPELEDNIVTTYITTIIVDEEQRGRGITTSFYREILKRLTPANPITTRTWSTNDGHIRILERLGFKEVARIMDARGQGIDTVYFRKTTKGDS